MTMLLPQTTVTASAASGDRTLYLYHTHTKETGRFTFKRDGKFDDKVLKQLNVFLADWRTKEPTKMDPALFDLLWSVYQDVGASQPINIVSSYRSPKTNAALRKKSSGVAENSQHMKGKAMDFFIPGVNLTKLRESVMRHQVGGVGFYPTSGSPFVHADTGNVRAWPRMTRAQLKKVFPDGRTLHIPTDGKILSAEGRRYAEAEWKKCHAVPCNGAVIRSDDMDVTSTPDIMLAETDDGLVAPIPAERRGGRDALLTPEAEMQLAALDPTQRIVNTIDIVAPMPANRGHEITFVAKMTENGAPIPAVKSARLVVATRTLLPGETALAAVAKLGDEAPRPRVLMTKVDPNLVTAYVPTTPDPGAELALRMIIERSTPDETPLPELSVDNMVTASLGGASKKRKPKDPGLFDLTFDALSATVTPEAMADALADLAMSRQPNESIELHEFEMVPPEVDHVNETLVHPVPMTDDHFAFMTEAEGYLDKTTELGPLSGHITFLIESGVPMVYDRFITGAPLIVAAR